MEIECYFKVISLSFQIMVIIMGIYAISRLSNQECLYQPSLEKECFLSSNTALGEMYHKVSCNKDYTFYRLLNVSISEHCSDKYVGGRYYDNDN